MIAIKGLYNGKSIEFLEPLPSEQAQKNFFVIVTFLEEKKSARQGVKNKQAVSAARLQAIASYRFPAKKQRRMDELLDKGNAGELSLGERRELDKLVDEFEERTLQKSLALEAIRETEFRPHAIRLRKAVSSGR